MLEKSEFRYILGILFSILYRYKNYDRSTGTRFDRLGDFCSTGPKKPVIENRSRSLNESFVRIFYILPLNNGKTVAKLLQNFVKIYLKTKEVFFSFKKNLFGSLYQQTVLCVVLNERPLQIGPTLSSSSWYCKRCLHSFALVCEKNKITEDN